MKGTETSYQLSTRFEPGQVIGDRYRILGLAGAGGMGTVYRAHDLVQDAQVAIKFALWQRVHKERFVREAQVLTGICHPAVVRYEGHGETAQGLHYLVMEWLEGESLGQRLERSGLSVEEALALARRVSEGLSAVHDKGVVHRDLKPGNLLLVDGRADACKLLDFGIAHPGSAAHTLTGVGGALGTMGYMAPEQALSPHDVDARADLFALGCVLFECLTRRPAFPGDYAVVVLANVLRGKVSRLRDMRPDLPRSLDELLARLLAKDRSQRPRDTAEVLRLLDAIERSAELEGSNVDRFPPRLVHGEQRISSVIVARQMGPLPETVASEEFAMRGEQLDSLLERFGASAVPLGGGQLVLVFGGAADTIASDQASQAVRCALRLHQLMPQYSVGVGTGSFDQQFNVSVGTAIDRAAALLAPSPEGPTGVLVDALTADLSRGGFDLRRLRPDAYVVDHARAVSRPRRLLGMETPFVGRQKELGLLEATLTECIEDQVARTLLIMAEPGIGKSRLSQEFLERAGSLRARVLFASTTPASMRSSMFLMQQLLGQALSLPRDRSASSQHACLRRYLEHLVEPAQRDWLEDFLGELLNLPSTRAAGPRLLAARSDPAVMREQTRRATEVWLSAESRRAPIVVLLEDLQWADLPSIHLLEDVVSALRERPIFVLALARLEVRAHAPDVFEKLGGQELRLQPLTRRAAERLVREVLPHPIDDGALARVIGLADGNAFYLEELIRSVLRGTSDLPETLRVVVRSRLERLDPAARRLLRAASVFGETCWAGGVAALLGDGTDVDAWFRALTREEIFAEQAESRFANERAFTFRHALLRDAAYAMLTDDDRCAAHALAAQWLEQRGEQDDCVLADHLERSATPERAAPHLLRAARKALHGEDLKAAMTLGERGVSLGPGARERGELLLVQAHASAWGTSTNLAMAREALSLLPPGSTSWWFALSLLVFGASATGHGELASPYLDLAVVTSAPTGEPIGAFAQGFEVLAVGAVLLGHPGVAWSILAKLEEVVSSAPDPISGAWHKLCLCQLATNSLRDGAWRLSEAYAAGRDAVEAMRSLGAISGEATARFHAAGAARELGRYAESETLLRESRDLAQRAGNVLIAEFSSLVLAVFALRQGKEDDALAQLSLLQRSADANVVQATQTVRAEIALRQGHVALAVSLAKDAARGAAVLYRTTAALTLARAHLQQSRAEVALSVLAEVNQTRRPDVFPHLELGIRSLTAQVFLALGRREAARQTAEQALRFISEAAAGIADPELRRTFEQRSRLAPELRALVES